MNSNGRDKVLFGTNFPQLALGKSAEQARSLELKADARAAFHDNARRVFNLP
jgi:predicted TIM-barrel fold metal-dependent hydrolase